MPLSVTAHNAMLEQFRGSAAYVGLCSATTLAADVVAGASSVDLNHAVEAGDWISLNDGGSEKREVAAVSGSGPYMATLVSAASFSHASGSGVGHAPKAAGALREPSTANYSRQSITWDPAASENLSSSNVTSFEVESGSAIGGFLMADSADPSTATFLGSYLTSGVQVFGSDGTYDLTSADVNLES